MSEELSKDYAFFDCRVWNVPDLWEASNVFLWREQDATRNSIQMAARSVYSHRECHKKNMIQLQEMLFQKGINWNDYPEFFKRGTYFRKVPFIMKGDEILQSVYKLDGIPILSKIENRPDVLYFGAVPILKQLQEK